MTFVEEQEAYLDAVSGYIAGAIATLLTAGTSLSEATREPSMARAGRRL